MRTKTSFFVQGTFLRDDVRSAMACAPCPAVSDPKGSTVGCLLTNVLSQTDLDRQRNRHQHQRQHEEHERRDGGEPADDTRQRPAEGAVG